MHYTIYTLNGGRTFSTIVHFFPSLLRRVFFFSHIHTHDFSRTHNTHRVFRQSRVKEQCFFFPIPALEFFFVFDFLNTNLLCSTRVLYLNRSFTLLLATATSSRSSANCNVHNNDRWFVMHEIGLRTRTTGTQMQRRIIPDRCKSTRFTINNILINE